MKKAMLTGMLAALVVAGAGCGVKDVTQLSGPANEHRWLQTFAGLTESAAQVSRALAIARSLGEWWLVAGTGMELAGSPVLSLLAAGSAPEDAQTLSVCLD
jgi:hypothetical protein